MDPARLAASSGRRYTDAAAPAAPRRGSGSGRRGTVQRLTRLAGELLVTAGVVMLLFVAWQLWWTNIEAGATQDKLVESLADSFAASEAAGSQPADADYGEPPVIAGVDNGQPIGIMYIPRFDGDYARPIVSGVGSDVLDQLGLGHYPNTAMPGEVGNFAVAGHRQTHGQVLDEIHTLVPGDKIYVQSAEGYFTYVFRNNQVVLPDRADVLLPVPTHPSAQPTERIMTMTSCNPRFGSQERIIAYSVMESWQPLEAGAPAGIADQVAAAGQSR